MDFHIPKYGGKRLHEAHKKNSTNDKGRPEQNPIHLCFKWVYKPLRNWVDEFYPMSRVIFAKAPENGWLEDDSASFWGQPTCFQG